MKIPASLLPLSLKPFIIAHITTHLIDLTIELQAASTIAIYHSNLPRHPLPLSTLLTFSRTMRDTGLFTGLRILVDDLLEEILRPDLYRATQLARHHVVVRDYEVALERMRQARGVLVDMVERTASTVDEKVVGDPVDVGAGVHMLSTAMYSEEREEDQVDVVMAWMWEGRRLFLESIGAVEEEGEIVIVADVDIV